MTTIIVSKPPIRAEIIRSDTCSALGTAARAQFLRSPAASALSGNPR
jgi:hypothetical protein